MSKTHTVTCIKFSENQVSLLVVDPSQEKVTLRELLTPGFAVLNSAGKIAHPSRLANLLQQTLARMELPSTVRVLLGLQYMELKVMEFPSMPEPELGQVIRDEAARESIFSYSGDPIAVAYRLRSTATGDKIPVLTATVPQDIIGSIIETFKLTDFQLQSIRPGLAGLEQAIEKHGSKTEYPRCYLLVADDDAELYVATEKINLFWRYLTVGANEPERLQNEVAASLEHFQSRATQAISIQELSVFGVQVPISFEGMIKIQTPSGERWPELLGEALDPGIVYFSFYSSSEENQGPSPFVRILTGICMTALLAFNITLGWRLFMDKQRLEANRSSVMQLRQTLNEKQLEISKTEEKQRQTLFNGSRWDASDFLSRLRAIVPHGLRLQTLTIDIKAKQISISGICVHPKDLDFFILQLKNMKEIGNAEIIEAIQKDSPTTSLYLFNLNLGLEASRHE